LLNSLKRAGRCELRGSRFEQEFLKINQGTLSIPQKYHDTVNAVNKIDSR